jgi:hypothetical protein
MTVATRVVFVRTYGVAVVPGVETTIPTTMPAALAGWIDRRIVGSAVAERVLSRSAVVQDVAVTVSASLLLLARSATVDVFLEVCSDGPLPDQLMVTDWSPIFQEQLSSDGEPVSVHALLDEAVANWPARWAAYRPSDEQETTFGSVAFVGRDSPAWRALSARDQQVIAGSLAPGDTVFVSRNHLRIANDDIGAPSDEHWWGYLMLAALAGRARHLKHRLQSRIATVADDPFDTPWMSLRTVASIQREALIVSPDLVGADVLGDERLISLHQQCHEIVELTGLEREQLRASLDNLDRYVNGLFSVAVDQSQARFALFGLVFGVFSLCLASLALLDVLERPWLAYALTLAANVVMAGVVLVFARRLRARIRSVHD